MKLTRNEAIEIAGTELIDAVEEVNCDFTGCVTDGTEWTGYTQFSATTENDTHRIVAYYFQDSDLLNDVEDLSDLDWSIDHYEIEEV